MENESEKALLSVQQASKRLGLSVSMVRDLIISGRLRAVDFAAKDSQHTFRIKPEWVDELIAESEVEVAKPRVKQPSQNLRHSKFATIRRHG